MFCVILNFGTQEALDAIESLKKKNATVNFNSVKKESGVSKHYLYEHEEIRTIIEKLLFTH